MSKPQLQKLLVQVAHAARERFSNQPMRVWYAKIGPKAWKTIVINTENKVKIVEGPVRASAKSSLTATRNKLTAAKRKTS